MSRQIIQHQSQEVLHQTNGVNSAEAFRPAIKPEFDRMQKIYNPLAREARTKRFKATLKAYGRTELPEGKRFIDEYVDQDGIYHTPHLRNLPDTQPQTSIIKQYNEQPRTNRSHDKQQGLWYLIGHTRPTQVGAVAMGLFSGNKPNVIIRSNRIGEEMPLGEKIQKWFLVGMLATSMVVGGYETYRSPMDKANDKKTAIAVAGATKDTINTIAQGTVELHDMFTGKHAKENMISPLAYSDSLSKVTRQHVSDTHKELHPTQKTEVLGASTASSQEQLPVQPTKTTPEVVTATPSPKIDKAVAEAYFKNQKEQGTQTEIDGLVNRTSLTYATLKGLGLTDIETSAFMGNFLQETGDVATRQQRNKDGSPGPDSSTPIPGRGFGKAQWTSKVRQDRLVEFAKSANVSVTDPSLQDAFAIYEMKNFYPETWAKLQKAESVAKATLVIHDGWEMSADNQAQKQQRVNYAELIYKSGGKSWTPTPTGQ